MNKALAEIEKEASLLTDNERAILAHHLIKTLDKEEDENVEELWLNEAEKRYDDFLKGEIKSVLAMDAFAEARKRLT